MNSPCSYGGICGGCPNINTLYAEQCQMKANQLRESLRVLGEAPPVIDMISPGPWALRDKADLALQSHPQPKIGYYEQGNSQQLIDIESCPLMSVALLLWYKDLRQDPPPLSKASLRLRVSPTGLRGLWIDASNTEIKSLLVEEKWLERRRAENVVIELGQKKKQAQWIDNQWRLKKESFHPWFETYTPKGQALPLQCNIASFTQVGFAANRSMVQWIFSILREGVNTKVLELGSGIGNFTLAMAAAGAEVIACEWDVAALKALALNIKNSGNENRIISQRINFYQNPKALDEMLKQCDTIFVDPPRSGLGSFVDMIKESKSPLPVDFLYVSCSLESLQTDLRGILSCGYELKSVAIVDQFPHTSHGEYLLHLTRR